MCNLELDLLVHFSRHWGPIVGADRERLHINLSQRRVVVPVPETQSACSFSFLRSSVMNQGVRCIIVLAGLDMPADSELDLQLEIGHVLLIDIVGYSKLLITEQRERLQALNEIVRNTAQFRVSDTKGMLVRIPTGDGMALIFRDTVEAPLRCAVEISEAIKTHPEIHLRMGIHSGPVSEVRDVNERTNIAGAGIDIAQRVMDCGDAGHILLSKHVAEDLAPHPRWNRYLHDLGECEVKHGDRLDVVNLYTGEVGNPQVPIKFRQAVKRRRRALIAVLILLAATVGGGYYFFSQRLAFKAPDKSIAVLP